MVSGRGRRQLPFLPSGVGPETRSLGEDVAGRPGGADPATSFVQPGALQPGRFLARPQPRRWQMSGKLRTRNPKVALLSPKSQVHVTGSRIEDVYARASLGSRLYFFPRRQRRYLDKHQFFEFFAVSS